MPCGFDIEWYGFDEGDDIISTVTLTMHAPTKDVVLTPGGPSEVFVGGDPATGAGTDTGFDGEATYYPTFDGEPHPKQGYHVKLDDQHARLAGRGHQAQGLLGRALRDARRGGARRRGGDRGALRRG